MKQLILFSLDQSVVLMVKVFHEYWLFYFVKMGSEYIITIYNNNIGYTLIHGDKRRWSVTKYCILALSDAVAQLVAY
jgi:hypothetical protein